MLDWESPTAKEEAPGPHFERVHSPLEAAVALESALTAINF